MNDRNVATSVAGRAVEWPSPARGWYAVAALWFAYVVSCVDRFAISFLVDPIKRDLGVSDTQVGLLIGFSFAIFYSAFGLPIARYADRGNRVRLILFGILLWSGMTATCGFAWSFLTLFIARIGVAIGEAVLQPSALSLISDFFPAHRKSVPISVYVTASMVGTAVAYALGGWFLAAAERWDFSALPFLDHLVPWQLAFVFMALPGLLAAPFMLSVREPLRQEKLERNAAASEGVTWREFAALLRRDRVTYATIVAGPLLVCVYVFALVVWLPSVLTRIHAMPAAQAGALMGGAFLVGGSLGVVGASYLSQWLLKRGHEDGVMRAALYCSVLAFVPGIATAFAPNAIAACVAFFFFILFGSGLMSLPQAALQIIAPNEIRARVQALWGFCVNLFGLGFGPTIAAIVSDALSADGRQLDHALALVGVPSLAAAVIVIWCGLGAVRGSFARRRLELTAQSAA